jgi:hypothetical protein
LNPRIEKKWRNSNERRGVGKNLFRCAPFALGVGDYRNSFRGNDFYAANFLRERPVFRKRTVFGNVRPKEKSKIKKPAMLLQQHHGP